MCPLDQVDVDKHGIVLTLGCKGPSYEGPDPIETIRIKSGEVTEIIPGTRQGLGQVACTNPGFNIWLQTQKDKFKAV